MVLLCVDAAILVAGLLVSALLGSLFNEIESQARLVIAAPTGIGAVSAGLLAMGALVGTSKPKPTTLSLWATTATLVWLLVVSPLVLAVPLAFAIAGGG